MSDGKKRPLDLLQRLDGHPMLLKAARGLRARLPGDVKYGDPLSVAGDEAPQVLGRRLAQLTAKQPGALRELGFSALQVWQSVSEAQGRGRGDRELAIVFTDLVAFSSWALDAGDDQSVELLRRVGETAEPIIEGAGGRVVKRLGDGLMAVFEEPHDAVRAALEAADAVERIQVGSYRPRMRAGVHLGRPRKLGADFFGVDVNVAARVAAAAGAGEVLVSEAARERLDDEQVSVRRKWRFRAKGTPKDLRVYAASSPG
ncbi:MAG: Purine cyclase-related protein [uncultured Solirubrobacteraceae bacterium]|uniref:Purine cyclase-related protein n=1 Tax=uncultured Solirubrobacteraceae bacterium TaxID=1162706 RepID=A0A6J4TTD4_9ACTN|nr:MAG: Purine cyclase-related protein [uncultured Solirubrobacteraceae bacterium]